jgi:hypothetical protein
VSLPEVSSGDSEYRSCLTVLSQTCIHSRCVGLVTSQSWELRRKYRSVVIRVRIQLVA